MRMKECPQKCYVNIKCPMQMIAIVVVTSSEDTCCILRFLVIPWWKHKCKAQHIASEHPAFSHKKGQQSVYSVDTEVSESKVGLGATTVQSQA